MQLTHRLILTGLPAAALGAFPAGAQTLDVSIELPRVPVAEYHRPYVAVWIELEGAAAKTLSVWYDVGKRNNSGTKWLRDVRLWWRAAGRSASLPADGISGATRAAGTHKLSFVAGRGGMPVLAPGRYTLVVEAARESGGREALRIPFAWTGARPATGSAKGAGELGAVSINLHK